MPPRPSLYSASSSSLCASLRPSPAYTTLTFSQSCIRATWVFHESRRTIRYDSFIDRKNKAKAWLGGEGQRYKRPLGAGRTNYLRMQGKGAGATEVYDPKKASRGQEGGASEAAEEMEKEDPWEDEQAVERLKKKYNVEDEKITKYAQEYEGLTPAILGYVLEEGLEGDEIKRAIKDRKTVASDGQFDSDALAREEATRRVEEQKRTDKSERRKVEKLDLQPFKLNKQFVTQPVLSEEMREMIYLKVKRDGLTVRTASALLGVSMERVGAVVRMKQMERDWIKEGKPLAVPYSRAILDMMPTTPYVDLTNPRNFDRRTGQPRAQLIHDSINDLPVHPSTNEQVFLSVPESRHFTRQDAAKAFDPRLKSADERIPHTELLEIEKYKRTKPSAIKLREFTQNIMEKEKKQITAQAEAEKRRAEEGVKVYEGKRWNFKFQDVSVDDVGKDGRGRSGVGWRYGMPHEDRKRGQVKIPTSVS